MINIISIENDTINDYAIGVIRNFFDGRESEYTYAVEIPNHDTVFDSILDRIKRNQINICFLDLNLDLPPKLINDQNLPHGGFLILAEILKAKKNLPVFILTAMRWLDVRQYMTIYEVEGSRLYFGHKYDEFALPNEIRDFLQENCGK